MGLVGHGVVLPCSIFRHRPHSVKFPRGKKPTPRSGTGGFVSRIVRVAGLPHWRFLRWLFVGRDGHRIVSFSPFTVHHGMVGHSRLIGWAYLVGAFVSWCSAATDRVARMYGVAALSGIPPNAPDV